MLFSEDARRLTDVPMRRAARTRPGVSAGPSLPRLTSESHRMPQRPRLDLSLHALEPRTLLSVAAPMAQSVSVTADTRVMQPAATTPTLTVADRQELLNNWTGSDAATLAS